MPTINKCRGLKTSNSELVRPEGSLVVADNIVIYRDNTINPARGISDYGDPLPLSTDRVKQLIKYKNVIIRHYSDILQYGDGTGTFVDFDGNYDELEAGLRIKYTESQSNLYFTTNTGIKKISAKSSSEFNNSPNYIKNAGVPKGLDIQAELLYDIAGFLPPASKVAYRIVWGTKDINSNVILSSPSERFVITNSTRDEILREISLIKTTVATSLDGKYFIFYDGNEQGYFVWFNTGSTTQPTTAETVGLTPIEVEVITTDTADIVAAKIGNILTATSTINVTVNNDEVTIENNSGENSTDIQDGSSSYATGFTFTIPQQGQTISGQYSNVIVKSTIPTEILSDDYNGYFYQLYRSAVVTALDIQSIDEIEPDDELNLIYESEVTSAEKTAQEIEIIDQVPEDFRAGGALLYTNPNSAQGILQANDRPPIAKDIALFKGSIFFANTKTVHRKQLSMLTTSGFISGVSKFLVGSTEYTFVGENEISKVVTTAKSSIPLNAYFLINSANNENKYLVWFDQGISPAMHINGALITEHDWSSVNETIVIDGNTATLTANCTSLTEIIDHINLAFTTASPSAITNIEAFSTVDGYIGLRTLTGGSGVTFDLSGTALSTLSMSASTYTGTDEGTAPEIQNRAPIRVNIKSASTDAEVAQSLNDVLDLTFDFNATVDTNEVTISHIRNGIVDSLVDGVETPTGFTFSVIQEGEGEDASLKQVLLAKVTADAGSLSAAQAIDASARSLIRVINKDNTSPIYAYYLSSVGDLPGIILFESKTTEDVIFYLGSTSDIGIKFNPELSNPAVLASDNEVSPNRIYYSKTFQSEYVPTLNYLDVGPKDDEIRRIIALRDSLFILKDNGTYTLSGTYGNFTVRLLANSTNIIAPDSAVVLNNQIFMLTPQGIDVVSETGDTIISEDIKDEILPLLNDRYNFKLTTFGVSYESYKEYFLFLPSTTSDTVATQCYRYNISNDTFVRYTVTATSGLVLPNDDKLYIGYGDSNTLGKERKNYDRTDYANREYTLFIPANGVSDTRLSLSSVSNVEAGDVIFQSQYLTISKFNRLLNKLDVDSGIDKHSIPYSTLTIYPGADISNALIALVAKLNVDDNPGYTFSGTTDPEQIKTEYNAIIDRLNSVLSNSALKSYELLVDPVEFEALVIDVDSTTNSVTLVYETPFIVGEITSFKGIHSEVVWSPIHFESPEILKQVREGTFIFNQNNFYSAVVSYASDRNQEFEDIEVIGKGSGTWGGFQFGNATWGGEGNDVPVRTLIPREKQRCRYMTPRFIHVNAREFYSIVGISLEARGTGTKAYK